MTLVAVLSLALVVFAGTAVALTRDPEQQVIALGFLGLVLALLFVALEAPEVALSELAVGAVVLPVLYVSAMTRSMRRTR